MRSTETSTLSGLWSAFVVIVQQVPGKTALRFWLRVPLALSLIHRLLAFKSGCRHWRWGLARRHLWGLISRAKLKYLLKPLNKGPMLRCFLIIRGFLPAFNPRHLYLSTFACRWCFFALGPRHTEGAGLMRLSHFYWTTPAGGKQEHLCSTTILVRTSTSGVANWAVVPPLAIPSP